MPYPSLLNLNLPVVIASPSTHRPFALSLSKSNGRFAQDRLHEAISRTPCCHSDPERAERVEGEESPVNTALAGRLLAACNAVGRGVSIPAEENKMILYVDT